MDKSLEIGIKMNMRYKKDQLMYKAKRAGINTDNKTKKQLAEDLAKYDLEKFSRGWKIISGL